MSETFKKVLLALIILVFIPIWVPVVLQFAGFYVNQPGWKVAEIAAKKRDVKLCSKIWIMPWKAAFSPSSFDQMETCIHEYASITQDPTSCERLMPSDYGLNCINQSIGLLFKDNPEGENVDIHKDCSIYAPNPIRKDYCYFSQAHRTKDLNTCKEILNSVMQTACDEKIGAWYKYPQLRTSSYFGKYREQ